VSDTGLNEVKRRTMQVEAFWACSATIGRCITAEVLTNSLLGVPWSPWLFALRDFEVQREIRTDRSGIRCLDGQPMTADVSQVKLGTGFCSIAENLIHNSAQEYVCMVIRVFRGVALS